MLEALLQPLESAPHPRLDRAERLAELARELGVRQALEERERDRLLLPALECVDAIAGPTAASAPATSSSTGGRPVGRQFDFRLLFVVAVSVTVSTSRRRSRSRQRLRTMLVSQVSGWLLAAVVDAGVVPDADERFLQHLLGGSGFPQDTQRDGVQMRRREPVELGERPLVGQRGPRQELRERCAAAGAGGPGTARMRMTKSSDSAVPARDPSPQDVAARPRRGSAPAPGRTADRTAGLGTCASGRADGSVRRKLDERALGAAAYRARDVREAAARVPPGRMNSFSGGELGVEALDRGLEPRHMRIGDRA